MVEDIKNMTSERMKELSEIKREVEVYDRIVESCGYDIDSIEINTNNQTHKIEINIYNRNNPVIKPILESIVNYFKKESDELKDKHF